MVESTLRERNNGLMRRQTNIMKLMLSMSRKTKIMAIRNIKITTRRKIRTMRKRRIRTTTRRKTKIMTRKKTMINQRKTKTTISQRRNITPILQMMLQKTLRKINLRTILASSVMMTTISINQKQFLSLLIRQK